MIGKRTEKAIKKVMEVVATDKNKPRLESSIDVSDNISIVIRTAPGGNLMFRFYDKRINSTVSSFSLKSIVGKRYARRK